jgi:hypothetical protein
VLSAQRKTPWRQLEAVVVLGELALDGRVRPVRTEREFPSDKVYRRDDRGIVGVESFSAEGLAFFVIHTSVGRAACRYGSQFVHGRCGP